MLLAGVHGYFRNGRKLTRGVFQSENANGDALIANVSPRIGRGGRNKLRNRFLRFMAKRATQAARLRLCGGHFFTSPLHLREYRYPRDGTFSLDRKSTRL